ncbi:MAG: 3-deoxy-D-manno-octulosonic acid transferase, partial [Pseudomonadota bacterium]
MSAGLALWRLAGRAAGPLVPWLLARRARRGKEDPARMGERLGRPSRPRPEGPLVWVHAASVGEALSVLGLIRALREARPDIHVLMTTGTVTSARLMAERLPEGAFHQYAPVDLPGAVNGFLEHWRPDVGVWVESELWPGLVAGAAERGARLALVNARMSERSARGWRWAPGLIRGLLGSFEAVLAQDAGAAMRLTRLGARDVRVTGSLKAGGAPPDAPGARAELAAALAGRPVWLAASTHEGEEARVARAQAVAARACPGLLGLIAPRHPERGAAIAEALRAEGVAVSRRGAGERPGPGDELHLLDTLGEMGAWLRLAPVTFLGGSLVPAGGHNPHEPAALRSAILHGPHVENFAQDYAALAAAGGAREVAEAGALGAELARLLTDDAARHGMAEAARQALGDGAAALEAAMAALLP